MDPLPDIETPMAAAFKESVARVRAAGVQVRPVDIGAMVLKLHEAQQTVAYYEGARVHAERFATYGDRLLDLADLVRKGREISDASYRAALGVIADARQRVNDIYRDTPVILSPSATGPAPRGLRSTGDSSLNSAWTALGTPAISIPMPTGSALPLGLQITSANGQDHRALQAAVQIERMLAR
jgi:Asp-tRNA(Asn)/Glu-tRNA(Gln) amidotransferase A subunit family amidase